MGLGSTCEEPKDEDWTPTEDEPRLMEVNEGDCEAAFIWTLEGVTIGVLTPETTLENELPVLVPVLPRELVRKEAVESGATGLGFELAMVDWKVIELVPLPVFEPEDSNMAELELDCSGKVVDTCILESCRADGEMTSEGVQEVGLLADGW